jgi:hypothetical protein
MPLQTDYSSTLPSGFPGMLADGEPCTIVSRTLTGASLGFGQVVVQAAGDAEICAPSADRAGFLGITLRDQAATPAADPASPDVFRPGANVPVLTRGVVFVLAGVGVAAGDAAAFVPATGAIVTGATAGAVAIQHARFDTSAAAGALVKLRLA